MVVDYVCFLCLLWRTRRCTTSLLRSISADRQLPAHFKWIYKMRTHFKWIYAQKQIGPEAGDTVTYTSA
jgi:hypothetical protein